MSSIATAVIPIVTRPSAAFLRAAGGRFRFYNGRSTWFAAHVGALERTREDPDLWREPHSFIRVFGVSQTRRREPWRDRLPPRSILLRHRRYNSRQRIRSPSPQTGASSMSLQNLIASGTKL